MKIEMIQGVFDVVKNCMLFAIVAMVIFFPTATANFLVDRGLTKVSSPLGEIDLTKVATALSATKRALEDAAGGSSNPEVKTRLETAQTTLGQADSLVKTQLIDRPTAVQASAGASPAAASIPVGWIFVGRVDEAKKTWQATPRRAINTDQAPDTLTSVVVNDDLYVHDETATDANHSEGRVLGVLRKDSNVQVMPPPAYSHALGGGYFVWLKIRRPAS